MATTLNKVTVGNDFVLKIKVGLVQYGNNTVSWDYMDLTTCRNIVFNISCTKHNIDINLPFTIDSEDHSVISAIVRAELLHANSIYNFTISGLDSNGYRWTYISPKQQSFLTTAVTEETSAAAYTELAFTAGMIMPLAAQGKDGHTPYIGENNNWWINGVDTGISAIANIEVLDNYSTTAEIETMLDSYYTKSETDDLLDNVDLTGYATETYVDNAIENIDTSNLVEKSDIINGYFVDGSYIGLDTGVQLSDTLKFELDIQRYGTPTWYIEDGELISANVNSNYYMRFGSQMAEALRVQYENLYDKWLDNTGGSDFAKHHIVFNLHDGVYLDGVLLSDTGSQGSVIARVQENGDTIPNIILHLANSNKLSMYSLKIYDGDTLLRNYTPVKTDNGNGYYDAVNDTYLLNQNLEYKANYKYTNAIDFYSFTGTLDNKINNNVWDQIYEIVRDSDCTEAIDKILNNDTLNNGWDIHHLWEITQNANTHQHYGGRYHDCKIDCKLDKNDEVPYEKTYYRFWHPTEKKYYNINVEWTYNNALDGPVISATYTVDDYATKTYVNDAIANIPTPDLSNYVTNSSLSTTLADYVTATDLSTELSDYATQNYVDTAIANIPSGGSYTVLSQSQYDQLVADELVDQDQLYIII